jgi:lambda family phage portal protein
VHKPTLRQRIARWIAGPVGTAPAVGVRLYANARQNHRTGGFGISGDSSADNELTGSLPQLRARSRQMVRDSSYAKRAKMIVVNNVIGTGVALQAQVKATRGNLAQAVNDAIEAAWWEWMRAQQCHTGGTLHFYDLERAALGQVFDAGEVIIRKHRMRMGGSAVSLALELVESERIASNVAQIVPALGNGLRMGVEVDTFQRPVAYWISRLHPGDARFNNGQPNQYERVPASEVFHLKLTDRWPQTRGEPWMHTVLRKLDDMNEYSAAEVQAARDSAFTFGTIETTPNPDGPPPLADSGAGTGNGSEQSPPTFNIESSVIHQLDPGETLKYHTPTRPNTAIDPFLRYMLREVAAGVGVSYESLSRDYSQSNYSSSRLALLDDRDCWRVLQQWWVRSFREPLHREWLSTAVMSRAISAITVEAFANDSLRYEGARFKVRGWSWIDPAKEVAAYKEAERAGYITKTQVVQQTANGMDFEDVLNERKRELEMLEEADIVTDTVPSVAVEPAAPAPPAEPPEEPDDDEEKNEPQDEPPARLVSFRR